MMTTTVCASTGSGTGLLSHSPVSLPHPCKLLLSFYLPTTRLNPIHHAKQRLPLSSSPFCGNGELEIVSVKELADGFLHFSFGTPKKVDELSSSCGEHVAGTFSAPKRLPSKFSKKLPIPVAAVRRRRQEKSSSKEGSAEATPSSVKKAASSSRPKSCFIKRSPITRDKKESVFVEGNTSNGTAVSNKTSVMQEPKVDMRKSGRPPSVFVRNSPVHHARLSKRDVTPNSGSSPPEVIEVVPDVQSTSLVGSSLRPKSSFSRRSPVSKGQHFSQGASSTLHSGGENRNVVVSAKSPEAAEQSTPVADLDKCKMAELKSFAKLRGVKGYSKLKKAELLDVLKNLKI